MGYLVNYLKWKELYEVASVNQSLYPTVDFKDNVVGNSTPTKDMINPALLADIQKAAEIANVKPAITTAVTGHKKAGRHPSGHAVDIAMFSNKGYFSENDAKSKGIYADIIKFVDALVSMGYSLNKESGNDKSVLTFGFRGHDNHVHVSRKSEGSESPVNNTLANSTSTQIPSDQTNTVSSTPVNAASATFDDVKNRKIALRSGMTGAIISQIQSKLKELGLLTKEPNGEYDKDTYNAILQFQTNNSLKQDGVFGHKTYTAMFEPTAQVASVPTTRETATSKNMVNKKELYEYLKAKMSDIHSLGILANVQSESGFDSAAIGDNGTSGGLFQHHATRFTGLRSALGQDNWKTNWKGQVDYALSEKPGRDYLNKVFASPEQASEWWVRNFERPAQVDKQVILRNANIAQVKQDLRAGGVQIA